jgi:hypothetical protein
VGPAHGHVDGSTEKRNQRDDWVIDPVSNRGEDEVTFKMAYNTDVRPWLHEIACFFAARAGEHWYLIQPFSAPESYRRYHFEKEYLGLEVEMERVVTL